MHGHTKEPITTGPFVWTTFAKRFSENAQHKTWHYSIWTHCKIVNPKGVRGTAEKNNMIRRQRFSFFFHSILCSKKGSTVQMRLRFVVFVSVCWCIRQSMLRTIGIGREWRVFNVSYRHRSHFEHRTSRMNWKLGNKEARKHTRTHQTIQSWLLFFFFNFLRRRFFRWTDDYGYYCFVMQPIIIWLLPLNQMIVQYLPLACA